MFPQRLKKDGEFNRPTLEGRYVLSDHSYGKDSVKILYVNRNGPVHSIRELEVNTHLKLYTQKDYLKGDNTDIVATDSQKNTVYILAKKHGIKGPEEFALLLSKHFISKYHHVEEVHIHIEEYPWQRICKDEFNSGYAFEDDGCNSTNYSISNNRLKHNHAFAFTPTVHRHCDVILKRNDNKPLIMAGISGLRLLKTTQSSFVNFVNDEYRSLEDQHDRIFSTVVESNWEYTNIENLKFCQVFDTIKDTIIRNFAGDPKTGVPSPSVQNTLYLAEKEVLEKIPQIGAINITMPNKHYYVFNSAPFQSVIPGDNNEVFIPSDKPFGIIYAQLDRKEMNSKL